MSTSSVIAPHQNGTSSSRTKLRDAGICLLAAAIYFFVTKLSLILAFEQANISAIWPASGLALGGLVVFGRRFWPAVTLGTFTLTMSIDPMALKGGFLIAMGNTLEAVVGATLVQRFAGGRNCMHGASTVFRFLVIGAIIAPLLSATLGVMSLVLFSELPWSRFGESFFTWYTGNGAGILVFTPLVILWSIPRRRWTREEKLEGAALMAILILVGQAICGIFLTGTLEKWPSAYMVIPVLLWTAFRLGRRGAVSALIVLMAIAVAGTVRGFEVFPGETPNLSLLYLQIFLSVVAMMTLVVAGLVSELRLANESLELKVKSRTHRLEEMMREKDDLMAIAAHDLQAPLAGLRNLLQLVSSRPETLSGGGGDRVLNEMERTTDDMLRLVSSLLVAKRAEELEMCLTLVPCDAVELLRRMVKIYQQLAKEKGIEIQFEAPDALHLETHPESFSQIASNLISNAVKYSPMNAQVEVILRDLNSRASFHLEVRDQGPGIPPEEVELIFDKFHRADNQPTGGETSHGIGLYIVAKLATSLGTEVRYSDRPEGGSCFTVSPPSSE